MPVEFQEDNESGDKSGEIMIPVPEGWVLRDVVATKLNENTIDTETNRKSLIHNLPLVARRTEQLVEKLNENFMFPVAVSYIRIEDGVGFHVLLLIERADYLSPQIHWARLLLKQFTHTTESFDVRFVFSVASENMVNGTISAQGYTLMHVSDQSRNAA